MSDPNPIKGKKSALNDSIRRAMGRPAAPEQPKEDQAAALNDATRKKAGRP
jgi:hypothetical protein